MSEYYRSAWTREALTEALGDLGSPEGAQRKDSDDPSRSRHMLRWRCSEGGVISGVSDETGGYVLDADCAHERHNRLARMPEASITNVSLTDDSGNVLHEIEPDLQGAHLHFEVVTPVPAHFRVVAMLDPDDAFRAMEDQGHLSVSHERRVNIPLQIAADGPNAREGPARRNVMLRIEMLDLETAERDRGSHGITLWTETFPVRRS